MGPGFHLRYAGRLAWRYRLLFALGLALLGLLHPGFALASPLALLLPARLFARRALKEISRVSLAYATALAYGEDRLWAEARRVRLELPPFPWGLLLAYFLALLLVLALAAWRPGGGEGGAWSLPGAERPLRPPGEPAPGDTATPPQGQGEEATRTGGEAMEGQPGGREGGEVEGQGRGLEGAAPAGPGQEEGQGGRGPGEGQGRGLEDPAPAGPGAKGPGPQGEEPDGGAGLGPELGGAPEVLPPAPEGPGQGLLAPGGEGGEGALPSPWPGGRPPERVRRGAEVYLERVPLPPEARELLRRYFGAP
ncbi:hypothetical protein [Thermus sp.]